MTKEQLLSISGVGEKVASSLVDYFSDEKNRHEIAALKSLGVNMKEESKNFDESHPFFNKTLVLTGTLENMPRHEAMQQLKGVGARTADTVSKKVDFLVVGAEPGSKVEKAKKLGVPILDEQQFLKELRHGQHR